MPSNPTLDGLSDEQILEAIEKSGGANAAARSLGIPLSTFKGRAKEVIGDRYVSKARKKPQHVQAPVGKTIRYIFTSAQNGTDVDIRFLRNLEAYAKYVNATIMVAGYTYKTATGKEGADFHPSIRKYLTTEPVQLADKLTFCAELDISPTQVDPLAGFETYTRDKWGVFPHPRVTLKSIPVMWTARPKLIMTTGTLTKRNYQQRKAGLKAEFHHVVGAVIVEVDTYGAVFARHLIAEKDGSFQDLTTYVTDRAILTGMPVEAVTWGDTHPEMLDESVALGSWGLHSNDLSRGVVDKNNILDVLRPRYQFFHDALDMRRRNHHSIDDPHKRFKDHQEGTDSVEEEVVNAAHFIEMTQRTWCQTYVIDSNHDRALLRWLKTADYRSDPVNAVYFLKLQHAVYQNIADGNDDFLLVEHAFRETGCDIDQVTFLKNTDSFVICEDAGGGIECALHGDLGANGSKGHINAFSKMGPKANIGHTHSAAIFEGIYVAGHSCQRDMVYNRGGLTSWSPSHIVTYPNGKRALITMQGARFCGL